MAFYSAEQLYAAARDLRQRANKTNDQLLREARETAKDMFDVFLSHSSRDKDLVLGAKKVIEDAGYTVYVDWLCPFLRSLLATTSGASEAMASRRGRTRTLGRRVGSAREGQDDAVYPA